MRGKEDLIKIMKEGTKTLKTQNIEEAFKNVDRADFVPSEYKEDAYLDQPLYIGAGQTISQPSTVAFMLELLELKKGEKILDVGSGSGWTTALLAYISGEGGEVIGVEKENSLVNFGKKNLSKYNFKNVYIERAGHVLGKPQNAPYKKILVSATAQIMPEDLINQLRPGGIMVIPVENSIWKIKKNENGEVKSEEYEGFVFVPLIFDN